MAEARLGRRAVHQDAVPARLDVPFDQAAVSVRVDATVAQRREDRRDGARAARLLLSGRVLIASRRRAVGREARRAAQDDRRVLEVLLPQE